MEILKASRKSVQIDLSFEEFVLLTRIVHTADEQFELLDAIPYQLDEERVADFSDALRELGKTVIQTIPDS